MFNCTIMNVFRPLMLGVAILVLYRFRGPGVVQMFRILNILNDFDITVAPLNVT